MSKIPLQSPKSYKKRQIYDLADHGVKWPISKMKKICEQGVELRFFVLRFQICIRGVALK